MTIPAYIFDIDGTIADHTHRLHFIHAARDGGKDWDSFHDRCHLDPPIAATCKLALAILTSGVLARVLFVTGRMEYQRPKTQAWLRQHVGWSWADQAYLDLAALERGEGYGAWLLMRPDGDHREDTIVKEEILDRVLATGVTPIMAFEDRPRVCDMWRRRGLVVAKIGEWQEVNQSPAHEAWAHVRKNEEEE
jgi:hypothetical protein